MWPFRNWQRELDQAELTNESLRQKMHDSNREWRQTYGDLNRSFDALKTQFDAVEYIRQQLERTRISQTEIIEQHVRNEKDLNRVLGARDTMCKALAAERDEAVTRARRMEVFVQNASAERDAAIRHATLLKAQLASAMVRDPKTGRMVKWSDTVEFTLPEGHGVASTSLGLTSGTQVFVDQSDESLNGVGS